MLAGELKLRDRVIQEHDLAITPEQGGVAPEPRAYIQQAANSPASSTDQLTKLADLRDRGVISAEEFERQKAKVLAA